MSFLPFNFSSMAASANRTTFQIAPFDLAAYALCVQAKQLPEDAFYAFTLELINFDTGEVLFDEPIQNLCIQSDCRGLGLPRNTLGCKLPSEWFIRKNQRIVCNLRTFAGSTTENYFITLLCREVTEDPNPRKKPFFYIFSMNLGFQDNVQDDELPVQTSVNFNQQVCNTLAKHMLHDFELVALVLDPRGKRGFLDYPRWSFQVELPGNKKLFDRMIINGCAGGGTNIEQADSIANPTVVDAFIDNEVWQYVLPQPEIVRKRQLIRVDISPAITYLNTDVIHYAFNEPVCMALIGNHLF